MTDKRQSTSKHESNDFEEKLFKNYGKIHYQKWSSN